MKIDKMNEQINLFNNSESIKGGEAKSFKQGVSDCSINNFIDDRLIEIAQNHDSGAPVSLEESKKITKIMQEENIAVRNLSSSQQEELNTMIAEFLIKDPVLSSKLLHILKGLKS